MLRGFTIVQFSILKEYQYGGSSILGNFNDEDLPSMSTFNIENFSIFGTTGH
jgi:hypothetical protein